MFKNVKLIIGILILGFSFAVNAQKATLVRIEIQKELSENDFEKKGMRLFFLVKSNEIIQGLDKEHSKVISFMDNNGNDLLVKHEQEINNYKKLVKESVIRKINRNESIINYSESQTIPDGLGLVFDSWVLPDNNTTQLHLIADISISMLASGEAQSSVLKNIDLKTMKELNWLGNPIPIKKSDYWDSVQKQMHKYQLQNWDLNAKIQKIEQVDTNGNLVKILKHWAYTNYTEFAIKEIDKPVNLKITYKNLKSRVIRMDQKFGLSF